jgi:hypothetical protein
MRTVLLLVFGIVIGYAIPHLVPAHDCVSVVRSVQGGSPNER